MTLRRALRWAVLAVVSLVVVFAAWSGWQAWRVSRDLTAAAANAQTLQDALSSGDSAKVSSTLDQLQHNTRDADDRSRGTTWSVLTRLPAVGDDAEGVRLVSQVLNSLANSGLRPLASQAADLTAFLPRNGRVPVEKLERLQQPVANADRAFATASGQLQQQSSKGFVGPLQTKYNDLTAKIVGASKALSSVNTALRVMPSMLGSPSPRNYLLVVQNNAEVRATGGLPGAVVLLKADDGRISIERQVAGASFGESAMPALPLSKEEKQVYGNQLGRYFLDANFTPNFSRAASLWRAHWERRFQERVDGVVSIDPVALSYLLEATGPVSVNGDTLDSNNAVEQLLHQTYIKYADGNAQDLFFQTAANAIFQKVMGGQGQARSILAALERAVSAHRLLIHSFHSSENSILSRTMISGDLPTGHSRAPDIAITLDDTTGSKMSYYLRSTASVNSASCKQNAQIITAQLNLQSLAPADAKTSLPPLVTGGGQFGVPVGAQLVAVRMYSPIGGSIREVAVNQKPLKAKFVELDRRQVSTSYILLQPQKEQTISWTLAAEAGETAKPKVYLTPGVVPPDLQVSNSAC